jgi:alkylation response protein AidB-like acyl-CoA dehydrogenase
MIYHLESRHQEGDYSFGPGGVQIHLRYGRVMEHSVEHYLHAVKLYEIGSGTNKI